MAAVAADSGLGPRLRARLLQALQFPVSPIPVVGAMTIPGTISKKTKQPLRATHDASLFVPPDQQEQEYLLGNGFPYHMSADYNYDHIKRFCPISLFKDLCGGNQSMLQLEQSLIKVTVSLEHVQWQWCRAYELGHIAARLTRNLRRSATWFD